MCRLYEPALFVQIKEDSGLPLRDKLLILSTPYRAPLSLKRNFWRPFTVSSGHLLSSIFSQRFPFGPVFYFIFKRSGSIHTYSCIIATAVTVENVTPPSNLPFCDYCKQAKKLTVKSPGWRRHLELRHVVTWPASLFFFFLFFGGVHKAPRL